MLTLHLYSISGKFTLALTLYATTFMRYALAVTPKNYLLFACHFVNFNAQVTQGYRWYDYWYMGGSARWEKIREEAKKNADQLENKAEGIAEQAKDKLQGAAAEVQKKIS